MIALEQPSAGTTTGSGMRQMTSAIFHCLSTIRRATFTSWIDSYCVPGFQISCTTTLAWSPDTTAFSMVNPPGMSWAHRTGRSRLCRRRQ